MPRAVRVLLDVNIFVANIIAHDLGHEGTATQTLVSMLSHNTWAPLSKTPNRSQLIISFEMIETLETVLRRMQFPENLIKAYSASIVDVMRYGPDALDPYLILGGEERFAMPDVEDAGVLATAFGARADILITDNLNDFVTKDASTINTQLLKTAASGTRILKVLRYELADRDIIVAHPFDVLRWFRLGYDFTPHVLWETLRNSVS